MTQEALETLCRTWQKRLRLQDWIVEVRVVRARDMATEGDLGNSMWNLTARRAIVKLLDPIDHSPEDQVPYDPEQTLVHELLHIHFALCDTKPETPERTAQEQAIDSIASALVALASSPSIPSSTTPT
ncbi:MAG: hypothetical protein ACM3ZU_08010 [Bacteroidota bacterium]